MVANLRHTGIVTDDLESSLKFYCDLLRFQEARCMEESNYFIETVLGMKRVFVKKFTQIRLLFNSRFISHKRLSPFPN